MKKLIVFLLLLAGLVSTKLIYNEKSPIFSLENVEKVCFVSKEKYKNFQSVSCGDLIFNFCTFDEAMDNFKEYQQKAEGLQLYFEDVSSTELLQKLKAVVVRRSEINDKTVIVAYTPFYDECIFVDGKKANLQLAEEDGRLIAGFPAILTGF